MAALEAPPPPSHPPVLLLSDALDQSDDEGTRKFAQALARGASASGIPVIQVDGATMFGKLFLSTRLLMTIRRSGARMAIYVPSASASAGSFLRTGVLRFLAGVGVVMIAPWANPSKAFDDVLARVLAPNLVLTPSTTLLSRLRRLGLHASFVSSGVDMARFRPADPATKLRLREVYGLPRDRSVVLHVGHLQPKRNLEWIVEMSHALDAIFLVVAGRASGADPAVAAGLNAERIRVLQEYLPDIERIYQLADAYCFPVLSERGAIGMPLSVLEAMASNLPVVSTRFGGLPHVLPPGDGLVYADSPETFVDATREALALPVEAVRTREKVLRFSWERVLSTVLSEVRQVMPSG